MGAFFLVHDSNQKVRAERVARLRESFHEQGFLESFPLKAGRVSGEFFGKLSGSPPQVYRQSDGQFSALCGTALIDGTVGIPAAKALAVSPGSDDLEALDVIGSYCAVVGKGEEVRLFLDPLGVFKVYMTLDRKIFSSSFLAIARFLGEVTPDTQGVYEYVHQEATYGGVTVAQEIRVADASGSYLFGKDVTFRARASSWTPRAVTIDEAHQCGMCLERLRTIYAGIANCFGDQIDTALSGGYDSRLTLALLIEQGVTPDIHVYGAEESDDVSVARAVTSGEGLPLRHIDKSQLAAPEPADYAGIVESNFLAFDGWPSSGIFDSGADLATRRDRANGQKLMLNGGGGEIFRNFFYLRDRSFRPIEVVWSFYNRYVPAWCTDAFEESAYLSTLADKILVSVDGGEMLSRAHVEYVYPIFRCGYWMGRNNSVNSRLGWSLTPFIDEELVRLAVGVPIAMKEHGRFEAGMIRAVSPSLAAYHSDYGHAFDSDPPLKRIVKDYATLFRPPWLRRFAYRWHFRRPQARPIWLRETMLERVVDTSMPILSEFFKVDRVNDPAAYARVATLEYLFSRFKR